MSPLRIHLNELCAFRVIVSSLTFSLFSKLKKFFPTKSLFKAPAWDFRPRRQTDISDVGESTLNVGEQTVHETTGFRLFSAQSRTLFSPSIPDLCLTAPASWPTQKYRLFCSQISRAKMEAIDRRGSNLSIAGNFFPTARALIGYFEVTWHLTMKLFPAKISEKATLQKSMALEGNSALLPANVDRRPPLQWGLMNFQLQNFQLYNKSLKDCSLGKQNELFPPGPDIKCRLLVLWVHNYRKVNYRLTFSKKSTAT